MGSGALIQDTNGYILLVKPSYKPLWEIPGGVVEENESPKSCCQREVFEELGIDLEIGRLLIVDYSSPSEAKSESLMFIFDGGTLSTDEIQRITLHPEELLLFKFFNHENLPTDITQSLKKRVLRAYSQKQNLSDVYIENAI